MFAGVRTALLSATAAAAPAAPTSTRGPELLSDPTFVTGYTNTRNTTNTSGLNATGGTNPSCSLATNAASQIGHVYEVTLTVTGTPNGATVIFGGTGGTRYSSPGTYTFQVTAVSAASGASFTNLSGSVCTVPQGGISIKEVLS